MQAAFSETDFSEKTQQIHITLCPNHGWKFDHGVMTFKLGTHVQCAEKELALQKLIPVHGLSEFFEESRKCLETRAIYLSIRLPRGNTQLTFDFYSYALRNAWQLLKFLGPMAPLKQLCNTVSVIADLKKLLTHGLGGSRFLEEARLSLKASSSKSLPNWSPKTLPRNPRFRS